MAGGEAESARVGIRRRQPRRDRGGRIEVDRRHIGDRLGAQRCAAGRVAQQQPRGGIVEHLPQSRAGIGRVERQIGAAGLEDGQQSHHHRRAALDADRHRLVGLHPKRDQMMGQPVGLSVQRAIAQLFILMDHRHRVGRPAHLRLEQLVHAQLRRIVRVRPVQLLQQIAALVGRQDVDAADRLPGIGDRATQEILQMLRHAIDLLRCQSIGIKMPAEAPIQSANLKCQHLTASGRPSALARRQIASGRTAIGGNRDANRPGPARQ